MAGRVSSPQKPVPGSLLSGRKRKTNRNWLELVVGRIDVCMNALVFNHKLSLLACIMCIDAIPNLLQLHNISVIFVYFSVGTVPLRGYCGIFQFSWH